MVMIEIISLFFPALLNTYIRRKILRGGVEYNKKKWLCEYAVSVLLINYLAIFILFGGAIQGIRSILDELNYHNNFSFKYMALTLVFSISEPWIEYFLKRCNTFFFASIKGKIWSNHIHILTIIYACVLAFINFIRIFDNNFWGDEAFTINLSEKSFSQMITDTSNDVHPPLYYIFVMLGCRLLGFHGWVYHFVSIIPYFLILLISLTLIKNIFGEEAAFILISFSSLLQCAIKYNVEVRMYSWGALFILFSFYELYRILEDNRNIHYFWFLVSSLAAAYTHYYALISVAFLYICLIVVALFRKRGIWKVLVTCVITVIAYLPWLFILIKTFQRTAENFFMTSIPSIKGCMKFIFYTDRKWASYFYCFVFLLSLLVAILYDTGVLRVEERKKKVLFNFKLSNFRLTNLTIWIIAGCACIFGTIAIGQLVSKLFRPLFLERYLFPVTSVAWLLVGVSISKLKLKKLYTFTLVAVILLVGIPNYINIYTYEKLSDKKVSETVDVLESMILKEDVILTDNNHLDWTILDYYFPGIEHQLFTSDFYPKLDNSQNYWMIISEDIDESIQKWLSDSQKGYEEVVHEGNLGNNTVHIYQLTETCSDIIHVGSPTPCRPLKVDVKE